MDFSELPRRPMGESVVPMINVVFLLLIFFLMTAVIAPPDPVELDLPVAATRAELEAEVPLYMTATGNLIFQDVDGVAAVLRAMAELRQNLCGDTSCSDGHVPRVALHADAQVAAAKVAALLPELARLGFQSVEVVTRQGKGAE